MRRLSAKVGLVLVMVAAFAASSPSLALAADGVGIGGPTDDRKVTYWAFGVMVFFAVFVIVASTIQGRLEGRKERVRRELERVRRPDA